MTGLVKVALIRDPNVPMGQPAPLHVVCPCGAKVPHTDAGMTCQTCGQSFDNRGWLQWSGHPDPTDPDNYWIDDATGQRRRAKV